MNFFDIERWKGLIAPEGPAEKSRAKRRGSAVHFYTGKNGSAKSFAAVYDTLPDLDAGTPVLSTIRLQDFRNPRPCEDDNCLSSRHGKPGHLAAHPCWVPWAQSHGGGGWAQFLDFRDGIILADEVTGIADAHEWAAIPVQVTNEWHQLRRREVVLRMTGLDFVNLHKRLRQATNAVTRCQTRLAVNTFDEQGNALMWRQRRLAIWTTYDAYPFRGDVSEATYETAEVLANGRCWIPGSLASLAYDTYEDVGRIETTDEKGNCAHCGGRRAQPQCSCPDYVESRKGSRRTDRNPRSGEDRAPRSLPTPAMPANSPDLDVAGTLVATGAF